MSKLMDSIMASAKARNKCIVLPEGEEIRIIQAAEIINKQKIARVVLLGDESVILSKAESGALDGVEIINPKTSKLTSKYAELLYEIRKDKGMTMEKATSLATNNNLYFGCLMVKAGDADGMVGGSVNSTGDVLRPALQIIKTKPGLKTVSGCFVMAFPEGTPYGQDGVLVFSDCAVLPDPTDMQLVDIAKSSAESAVKIAGIKEPKVAMLSFSTKGSASHENVTKVQNATAMLKAQELDFDVDGELQLDAAIVPSVGALKAPGSTVAGKANVLIFPDLQAGNIGYKLAQRFANAEAIGPICQGMAMPVNDLSRGCSVMDVVCVVAVTALQAK